MNTTDELDLSLVAELLRKLKGLTIAEGGEADPCSELRDPDCQRYS